MYQLFYYELPSIHYISIYIYVLYTYYLYYVDKMVLEIKHFVSQNMCALLSSEHHYICVITIPQPHQATALNMLQPITSPFLLASLVKKALKFCVVFQFVGCMHLSKVNPRVATFWIGTILPLLETRH